MVIASCPTRFFDTIFGIARRTRMSDRGNAEVTRMLEVAQASGGKSSSELLSLVYDQLRKIAQQRMNEERRDHTLEATALVHEAYMRLVGSADVQWANRAHFFKAAAEAMRRILIEHARSRGRVKRGGGEQKHVRVPFNVLDLAETSDPEDVLSVDEAVCRLEAQDPELGEIVRLRFYAGLSEQEAALALGVSDRTVRRGWALARAWLNRALTAEDA
jgi:RNA polymerase sigma factor (TIGR02999 family)